MSQNSDGASGGVGIFGLLGVAFVVLKLCNVIDWSWWYVTLPFWGPLALVLAFLVIFGIPFLILTGLDKRKRGW